MFGSGTYGPMGGQAAANEVSGQTAGYKAVEDIKTGAQSRKIQQEQWAIRKDLAMDEVKSSHMKLKAQETLALEKGAFTQENMQAMNMQMNDLKKQVQGGQKLSIGGLFDRYFGSKDPDEELNSINAAFKSNPQMANSMAIKEEFRPLTDSKYDNTALTKHLSKTDKAFMIASPEEQKKMLDEARASKDFVMNGKNVIGMTAVATGMGMDGSVSSNSRAIHEKRADDALASGTEYRPAVARPEDGINDPGYGTMEDPNIQPIPSSTMPSDPRAGTLEDPNIQLLSDSASDADDYQPVNAEGRRLQKVQESNMNSEPSGSWMPPAAGDFRQVTQQKRYDSVGPSAQYFFRDFSEFAKEKYGLDVGIASGGRTQQEQDDIYAQGRTKPGKIVTWTRNSKHIGGNALDLWSGNSQDVKENTQVAKAMREFTKANPQYGATFLPMKDDPNHVQFSQDEGVGVNENELSTPGDEERMKSVRKGEVSRQGNWRDIPYGKTDSMTRDDVLRNLAGWSDNRTSLMKDMDRIGRLLPGASVGEVTDAYKDLKRSSYDSGAKYPSFEYAKTHIADSVETKYGEDWEDNPTAVDEYNLAMNRAEDRFIGGGASEAKDTRHENIIANGMTNWSDAKSGKSSMQVNPYIKSKERTILNKDTENKKVYDEIQGKNQTYKSTGLLLKDLKQLQSEGKLNRGLFANMHQILGEYAPGMLSSDEDIKTMLDNVGVQAEHQKIMSAWLKALSGTAASDREVMRVKLQTGLDNWKDPLFAIKGMESFHNSVGRDVRMGADALGKAGYAETAKEFHSGVNPRSSSIAPRGKEEAPNSASSQASGSAKEVTSKEVFKRTPGTKWTNPKTGKTYYNNNGTPEEV